MKLLKRKSGFSLTELLITVGVIGILGGMSTPTYVQYRKKARRAEAYQMLSAIHSSQIEYFSEQGKYTEVMRYLTIDSPTTGGANTFYIYYLCNENDNATKILGNGTKMGAGVTPAINNAFKIDSCDNLSAAANPSFVAFALGQIDDDATLDNVLIGEKGKICEPPACASPDASHATDNTTIPALTDDVRN